MTSTSSVRVRSFPQPCSECGQEQVYLATIAYDAKIRHDGKLHSFHIPELTVNKCRACQEVYFDAVTSDEISQALRKHRKLLSPQEIQHRLDALGLSQKEFATRLRKAPETICRWLSGTYIQSCSSDESMRLFFACEEAKRNALVSGEVSLSVGELATWHYPVVYEIEVINEPLPDSTSSQDAVFAGLDEGPLRPRGPPVHDATLPQNYFAAA